MSKYWANLNWQAQLLSHNVHTLDHVDEFFLCGPAGGLAKTAGGGKRKPFGIGVLQAPPDAFRNMFGGFNKVAFDINYPD